ncbi:unnamed protein product, partial [Ranitomeya imitator]
TKLLVTGVPSLRLDSAYHPETNGLVERANQTLVTYLRHFVSARQDDWASLLLWAEFVLNNAVADSTDQTPFLLNYGQHPRVPVPMPVSSVDSRVADWAVEARDIWDCTQDAIRASKERMRSSADAHWCPAPNFTPGDLVWLSARNIRLRVESTKFAPRYLGPFKVLEQVNPVVYRLALPPRLGITDIFHVSLLKPEYMSRFSESSVGSSGSSTDDYEVNAILGCKVTQLFGKNLDPSLLSITEGDEDWVKTWNFQITKEPVQVQVSVIFTVTNTIAPESRKYVSLSLKCNTRLELPSESLLTWTKDRLFLGSFSNGPTNVIHRGQSGNVRWLNKNFIFSVDNPSPNNYGLYQCCVLTKNNYKQCKDVDVNIWSAVDNVCTQTRFQPSTPFQIKQFQSKPLLRDRVFMTMI